jgi:hypothetical protein
VLSLSVMLCSYVVLSLSVMLCSAVFVFLVHGLYCAVLVLVFLVPGLYCAVLVVLALTTRPLPADSSSSPQAPISKRRSGQRPRRQDDRGDKTTLVAPLATGYQNQYQTNINATAHHTLRCLLQLALSKINSCSRPYCLSAKFEMTNA